MVDRIFQILVKDGPVQADRFSDALHANMRSFREIYQGSNYHLFSDADIQDFLADNFDNEVLETYRALIPHAFKADLARYCLLFHHGGHYSDLSYLHLRPVTFAQDRNLVVFRDIEGHPPWATSNGTIFAKHAGLPVFERAINRILENRRQGYLGVAALDVTGPYLFGRALADGDDWKSTVFGESRLLSREADGRANIAKIMPQGEVIALRNKGRDCNISDLIGEKSQDYGRLWRHGQVWVGSAPKRLFKNPFKKGP